MFGSTYAVSWNAIDGRRCAGRLDLDRHVLRLSGATDGCPVEEAIPVREIHRVQIEGGHLRVTSHGGRTLAIGSLDAPGALRELAERLNAA